MELNILGSVWSVEYRDVRDDPALKKMTDIPTIRPD